MVAKLKSLRSQGLEKKSQDVGSFQRQDCESLALSPELCLTFAKEHDPF